MPTASSLAWKTSLRKVRTLWHCSRLRSVALYLWLIVVISVRQSTVAAISGLHCRALVMVSSSIRLTAWLQNSKKRAERSEIDVWAESPRLSPLWLSASSSACHGLLIITVITPLPTKPSAIKPENWSWRTRQYWHADASAWCCYARCKIHEGVSAAEMMLCVMMLPLVVVGCTSAVISQCVKPPPPPAWIMQPPPLADTAERDYFTLRELICYAKTTGRNPEVY